MMVTLVGQSSGRDRARMFKPADTVIDAFMHRLRDEFAQAHPGASFEEGETLARAGRLALTHVSRSNALYTNLDSALLITEVALRILEGRQIERYDVTSRDWLDFVVAALSVFTGFARGVFPATTAVRW